MGKLARESTHRLHGLTLTFLMASDRHHHQEHVIVPALRDGLVVVCDRYVLTALVLDQIDGAELGFIETIYQHMITPDVAVLLSCDPVAGRGRAAARGLYSRFQEGGVDAGRVEAALYEQIGERLAARGYPITTMDTTIRSAFQITSDVLDLLRLHLTLPQS
jgi:dTMP kinase